MVAYFLQLEYFLITLSILIFPGFPTQIDDDDEILYAESKVLFSKGEYNNAGRLHHDGSYRITGQLRF